MHDKETKKENALDAEWDKKRDNEKEKLEGRQDTKGTR
jgi:hypothetical protein